MRKISILVFVALLSISNSVFSQITLESVLNALAGKNYKTVNITTQTVTVNSTSKLGGQSKEVFKFTVPENTKKISFRATVIPVKSSFQYEENESFYTLIQNRKAKDVYTPQNKKVNFFIFSRSYDADGFLNNNNFKYLFGTYLNSFIHSLDITPGTYWIGVQNTDSFNGLKVIVEIVASGYFDK